MKITFCFPAHNYDKPIGGYKVIYEYSNRLLSLGYEVNIVYCIDNSLKKYMLPKGLRIAILKVIVAISPKWFKLDKRIKRVFARELTDKYIPDADVVFATAVETAVPISRLSESKGKKCYFIQDFENWVCSDEQVIETYKLGLTNIVVSKWLYSLLKKNGAVSYYIRNAIDISLFKPTKSIRGRNKYVVGMLYHKSEKKGVKYAIEGLIRVKENYPELEVYAFGSAKRPKELPQWFYYTEKASQAQVINLYNNCAIFLCATVEEGFGLTGLESMACGCALVSSSYEAVFEYAENERNSILYPVRDIESMCKCISRMLDDDVLRVSIAERGVETAKEYSWEIVIKRMQDIFNSI